MIFVIFSDFPTPEKKGKKRKNFVQKILMGYCPDCIVRNEKNCMAKTRLYCNRRGLEARSSVLQYTALYCSLGARQGWTVLQYSAQPSHNTVTVAATRRWARQQARAQGRVGARRRGRWAGRWASGRAAGAGRAWAGGRALQAAGRAGTGHSGARGRLGRRQAGAWGTAGPAAGARGARGLGVAGGYALGALGPLSIRFDSVFS